MEESEQPRAEVWEQRRQTADRVYQQGLEIYPRRCRSRWAPCESIDIALSGIKNRVHVGQLTEEEGLNRVRISAEDIEDNCRYGLASDLGRPMCSYGVLCRLGGSALPSEWIAE